ncbi:MAG TPA: glycosyltransferase family 4 protein [Humisphaera sp.]|nr:glycosyltransferase family 4 protein [Humisphaera sp.]
MKIALVTHNVVRGNGQGRVNYELVRYCRSVGIGVNMICEQLAPEVLDTGAIWNRLGLWINRPDLLHGMHFTPRANKLVRQLRGQVDLVVANGAVLAEPHAVNICHFVHGAWSRSSMHDSKTKRGPAAWYHAVYAKCNVRWERQAFDAAQTIVGVSAQVREELIGIGIDDAKVRVIVNGVDLAEFHPGEESREKLGLPAAGPLALFVGSIRTPRKNLDGVLRAVQKIPQMQLAVVGDEAQSPFPAMARKMGLADRVRFLGFRRDVPKLMRACDMFVFPSRYEACSLALLEALASGLPVISAKTAGGSELISPECGHVLADPEDLNGLVGAITRFLDGDVRAKAKIAARAVAEEHGWSHMGRQYVELFEEHLRKHKPRVPAGASA